ncbi:hypothetical protein PBRA_005971 [Plasmodiophora brassicae]|uniref:RAP domain-containing protein n=1 Tax=Plasmodiophora brassicae TaxID=37360 RepID=A0A0G4IRN6_PLABS|nr:hypothetical protein PBRA_005971 [Plasmodiophora brassicae]
MKVASVSSTCAVIATRADLPETSGVSLGLAKTDVKASAEGVGNHRRGSCPSIHSSVCQRRRSPPTMTSFALVLPVLVMAATITAMPVHRRAPRHSRTSNIAQVVNPTPLHVLDGNLRDGWRPSPSDVDRARSYLIQDRLHDQDFNVLPHLANKLAKYNAHNGVLSAIADALQRHQERVNRYNSREIAMLLHSLAKRRIKKRVLFNALGNRALEIMPDFNPQCVANTAWAFATLSIQNRPLFNALGSRALEIISGFNPQNVANTAWAFATVSVENLALFNALANRGVETISESNPQHVANTMWAFSAVRFDPDDRIVEAMVGRTCFLYSDGSFSDEHLVQLHLWRLFVGESRFDSVVDRVCHVKTDVMVSRFRDAMSRTMQLHVSRMEGEVVDALSRMYQPGYVVSGYICPGTGYSIDAALPKERIAVEVNGPMHFLRDCCSNRVTSMNGASRLKRYLLERYGWRIVDVNFEDWDKTGGDREQQQELLQQLLAPFS